MTFLDFWKKEKRNFDALLIDLDGTLRLGPLPLPGAAELIDRLRTDAFPFFFLSNASGCSPAAMADGLREMGIEAYPEEVVNAAAPTVREIEARGWRNRRFFLIGSPEYIREQGIDCEDDPARIDRCDAILFLGGAHDWNANLTAIFNTLQRRPELPVIIPNPDFLNPVPEGKITLCPRGQFELIRVNFAHRGIRIDPLFVGKPTHFIYDHVFSLLPAGCRRERVLGLGDALTSDIEGVNRAGGKSAVVLTGLTDRATAEAAEGLLKPDYIFESLI